MGADSIFEAPSIDVVTVLPIVVLFVTLLALLTWAAVDKRSVTPRSTGALVFIGAVSSSVCAFVIWPDLYFSGGSNARSILSGAFSFDQTFVFASAVISLLLAFSVPVIQDWLQNTVVKPVEVYAALLLAAIGAMIVAGANDLLIASIGLEVLSIPTYILVGISHNRRRNSEAALKYFVMGAICSAILLFGIALIYGGTGVINLSTLSTVLTSTVQINDGITVAGVLLITVGLLFKLGVVPLHFWLPDVYEGAPTAVTAFMASVVKAGALFLAIRVLSFGLASYFDLWQSILIVTGMLSVLVGALGSIWQQDTKRLLAYSSISHVGFMVIGLATGAGLWSAYFYLTVYSIMALGSFAALMLLGRRLESYKIDAFQGAISRYPLLVGLFTVLLLAQAGVPLTSGFLAKAYVIGELVNADLGLVGLMALLAAVCSAFAYLRFVVKLCSPRGAAVLGDDAAVTNDVPESTLEGVESTSQSNEEAADETLEENSTEPVHLGVLWVVGISAAMTIGLGVLPVGNLLPDLADVARRAADGMILK